MKLTDAQKRALDVLRSAHDDPYGEGHVPSSNITQELNYSGLTYREVHHSAAMKLMEYGLARRVEGTYAVVITQEGLDWLDYQPETLEEDMQDAIASILATARNQ